jgi:ABC-2 type transport system permease protein
MSAAREYWCVLKLHLRMQLSLSSISAKGRKRSGRETLKMLGYGLIILYSLGAVLLIYSVILFPFLRGAAEAGLQIPVMGVVVLLCMLLVLVFGTLTLLSLVFGARDAEAYAALPLREQSVFAVKFSMAYGIEMAVTALILWPAVVIYGIVSGFSAWEFFLLIARALPVWVLLPMAPMALAALIAMLFTRLMALAKRRDMLLVIFGLLLVLGLTVGQGMLMGRLAPVLEGDQIIELLEDNSAMLQAITQSFPPAMWCAQALVDENAAKAGVGFLGMTGAAAAGAAVCLLFSRRLYYKGVLAQMEAPRGKKRGYKQNLVKTGGALRALFSKEMKTVLRTPVYAMNVLAGVGIFPIMFLVVLLGQGAGTAGGIGNMLETMLGEGAGEIGFLLAAAVVMLTAVMGSTCVSTSFSREGRILWISQTAPVAAHTQVAAKLLAGFALTAAGAVLSMAVLVAAAGFTVPHAVFGLAAGLCAAFPLLTAAIIPDALKPKRKWSSEAEAMKQNFNSILALLLNFGIAVAAGVSTAVLSLLLPIWAATAAVAVICLAVGYGLFVYAAHITERMLKTVDG